MAQSDVELGRRRRAIYTRVAITNAGFAKIVPADPTIVAVILSPDVANSYIIIPLGQPDLGRVRVPVGVQPMVMRVEDVGSWVFMGLSAASDNANFSVDVTYIVDTTFRAQKEYQAP